MSLKEQKDIALRASLNRAGIYKSFHTRSLKEFGAAGTALLTRMDEQSFVPDIKKGRGYSFRCATHKSFDIAYIWARAIRLMGIDVRVTGLPDIEKYLRNPDADYTKTPFEDFDSADAIVIPRFYEPKFKPVSAESANYLEYYLTRRMQAGVSLTVQYQGDLGTQDYWSRYFVESWLGDKNEKVDLK